MKRALFLIIVSVVVFLPYTVLAQDVFNQQTSFNIEAEYDLEKRTELTATLFRISSKAYWYIDNAWWQGLQGSGQEEVSESLANLSQEFEAYIYPILTATFGSEWNPGIDNDVRITILIHPMKSEAGAYHDTADEYPKAQIPESNEREMLYLNAEHINTIDAKVFLAHEFVHLITFNQKNKILGVTEDIWLNEARAEYSSTLLGYDKVYEGSNLKRRVRDFLEKPYDSLTEWQENQADYGVANLFIQYIVDHYGLSVLSDTLKRPEVGIKSLNAFLSDQGFKEDFSQIFTDWTLAVLINDCQVSDKYCYFNSNLKNLRITPLLNYLPFVGQSTLSVTNATKDWSGNWHKFIGGNGTLQLDFAGIGSVEFTVPYIVQTSSGEFLINYLSLESNRTGKILLSDFGSENVSLIIMPIAQNKTIGFGVNEPSRTFFWSASTKEEEPSETINIPTLSPLTKPISQMSRSELLARVDEIKNLIVQLQALLVRISGSASCSTITQNLYFGLQSDPQVMCLQEFLKNQGGDIYPEAIVNGNFFTLTQQAVIRFQEKYASEILSPVGESRGTGFVGSSTRAKINELLTK